MTESGQVVRFETTIVDADGAPEEAEVVRIGGFIAMSRRPLPELPAERRHARRALAPARRAI